MAKTVWEFDGRGKVAGGKITRHMRKSVKREIPWTPAPQTGWQKFKRKAVG
jgi:hypothetical protein